MSKHRNTVIGLMGLCLLLVLSRPVYGQLNTATLTGTAKDTTGGVLPGVTVTLTQVKTGRVRTTITSDEGRYQATSLAVGRYQGTGAVEDVRASPDSRFGTITRTNTTNRQIQLGLKLSF
ncbi:MAG: carboxypeptidase-like regulatory domain-containing protein [Acidobacteria bacterium]|nr:carboxypeptidase-like regulatory domain-containing protein [Acidobacteriota bacterium]